MSVGELSNALRAFSNPDEYCACGVSAGECGFWRDVVEGWQAASTDLRGGSWQRFQAKFESRQHLFRLAWHGARQSPQFQAYAAGITSLYRAIQLASGKSIIVDSSKLPVRALALTYVQGVDVMFIHLVRDGRGVAWSMRAAHKKNVIKGVQHDLPARPVARTAVSWWLANALSQRALNRVSKNRAVRIRYEDFVSDPWGALEAVGALSGLDFGDVYQRLLSGGDFAVGHAVAGNRVRMEGNIRLRPDTAWKDKLPKRQRRVFWLIAGRMARRYGYRRAE